jgi:hypothetical protein
MPLSSSDLYELLPDIYRTRDTERGSPLRALLELVAGELDKLARDLAELYDDWFIGNSSSWVLVYVGELLGAVPRATRFAVSPVVDGDGGLCDFQLQAQTFHLHRVCWDESGRPAIARGRRAEIEYTAHGVGACALTYTDVWERLVIPIEDDQTTQTALPGPDAAERHRIVYDVQFQDPGPRSETGYQGLENQLYRIAVHDRAAGADSHGFAWSRDNGAMVAVLGPATRTCGD